MRRFKALIWDLI